MPSDFSGKWTMDRHGEMTTDLMDKMGIPADRRPSVPINKVDVEITQDGDKFNIKSTTPEFSNDYSFNVGETFETSLVGFLPKMTVSASWDGDQLLFAADNGFKMHRAIVGGQMVSTISKGDASFQVFFNKV